MLDIIRYLAALVVAVCHYKIANGGGNIFELTAVVSVEIFFVLSGFVLAPQINLIVDRGFTFPDYRTFIIRRWMRTLPSYYVALICAGILFDIGDFYNFSIHIVFLQIVILYY